MLKSGLKEGMEAPPHNLGCCGGRVCRKPEGIRIVRWISLGSDSFAVRVNAVLGMGVGPGGPSAAYGGSGKSVNGNGKLG